MPLKSKRQSVERNTFATVLITLSWDTRSAITKINKVSLYVSRSVLGKDAGFIDLVLAVLEISPSVARLDECGAP